MATRNDRRRKALARRRELEQAVSEAFALEQAKIDAKAAREKLLSDYPENARRSPNHIGVSRIGKIVRLGNRKMFKAQAVEYVAPRGRLSEKELAKARLTGLFGEAIRRPIGKSKR
jgi:hypothetical protein